MNDFKLSFTPEQMAEAMEEYMANRGVVIEQGLQKMTAVWSDTVPRGREREMTDVFILSFTTKT